MSRNQKAQLLAAWSAEKLGEWLSRDEMAKLFGVTVRTINNWTYVPGGIPCAHIGGRTYYRMETIRKWMEGREQRPGRTKRKAAA